MAPNNKYTSTVLYCTRTFLLKYTFTLCIVLHRTVCIPPHCILVTFEWYLIVRCFRFLLSKYDMHGIQHSTRLVPPEWQQLLCGGLVLRHRKSLSRRPASCAALRERSAVRDPPAEPRGGRRGGAKRKRATARSPAAAAATGRAR